MNSRNRNRLAVAIGGCLAAGILSGSQAADIFVDNDETAWAEDGLCSLVEAIINANDDDQSGSIDCAPGAGADTVILPANRAFNFNAPGQFPRALPTIDSTITISGSNSTISGNPAAPSFGIFDVADNGYLVVKDTTVANGSASSGGCFYVSGGTLLLSNSTVTNCHAEGSGGGIHSALATTRLYGSRVVDNVAGTYGGGILVFGGTANLVDSDVQSNQAGKGGGGISNEIGQLSLRRASVTNNTATEVGGGIDNVGEDARLTLYDSLVDGNYASVRGGGIYTRSGTVVLRETTISNNATCDGLETSCRGRDARGGGLYVVNGNLSVLEDSRVSNNSSENGAGISNRGGSNTVIHDSTVASNTARFNGGGVRASTYGYYYDGNDNSTLTVFRSIIRDNAVEGPGISYGYYNGAGIAIHEADAVIQESTISGNRNEMTRFGSAGGIIIEDGTLTIRDSVISGNSTKADGGGIQTIDAELRIASTEISHNTASGYGGGAHVYGSRAQLTGVRLFGNTADYGGGLAGKDIVINGATVYANSAREGGGLAGRDIVINGATVYANSAREGGGMRVSGTVIANSTIHDNQADEVGGGLLASGGQVEMATSMIFGNTADIGGGAAFRLYNSADRSASLIRNVTFSSNVATGAGGGLAISPVSLDTRDTDRNGLRLVHTTFVDNHSGNRGNDLWLSGAVRELQVFASNSIFASSEGGAGEACGMPLTTFAENINNFYADGSCGPNGVNTVTDNLILGPLADNGGPTLTHGVDPASDTVDAADASRCQATDQRGVPRDAEACDIGAFEVTDALRVGTESLAIDPNDGQCSLLEAIRNANNDDAFSTNPGECAPGNVNALDRIELPPGAAYDFSNAAGDHAALPEMVGLTEIVGHGATLRRTSEAPFRLLHNKGGLRLRSINLENFKSPGPGGAILNEGDLELTDVTLRDSAAGEGGGAVANAPGSSLRVVNSTLSGNESGGAGGALLNEADAEMTLRHTTLAFNDAAGDGAALASFGALRMENSLIVGSGGSGAGGAASQSDNCFVGSEGAFAINVNNLVQDGSCSAQFSGGSAPLVEPLADNGGANLTHALVYADNPAIDGGSDAACDGLRYDTRGAPFDRRVDGNADGAARCDIGAFEFTDGSGPGVEITADSVMTPGGTEYTAVVTYTDDSEVDLATIDTADVTVKGSGSTLATIDVTTEVISESQVVARYRFTPPGGDWSAQDNGSYQATVIPGQVADIFGKPVASATRSFNVAVAVTDLIFESGFD